jgi:hypothetical protein
MMAQARLRSHLNALKKRFDELLSDCEVQDSAGIDNDFRL